MNEPTPDDLAEHRRKFLVDPQPEPRFDAIGIRDTAIFVEAFDEATKYFEACLGPPSFVEEQGTRCWRIGDSWFTLLRGPKGGPTNSEIIVRMASPESAEAIWRAFVDAGGKGPEPSTELMVDRVRYCSVRDPFGTNFLFIAAIDEEFS